MGLNRNATPLKSYDRLEREIYRRDEDMGRWRAKVDNNGLPSRPKRGVLVPVPEQLEQQVFWHANTCLNCWSLIIPTNAQSSHGPYDTYVATPHYEWVNTNSAGVKGQHAIYAEEYELPEDPQWVHASTAHKKCYRDAGCVATFMPGIYVIDEMDM